MRILRLLTGYTLIILNNFIKLDVAGQGQCNIVPMAGILKAFCINKGFESVPQTLDPNIQYLDFSENKQMKDLNPNSFTRYKKLTWLSMRNCRISTDIGNPYSGFKSLENLEELDISGLQHGGFGKREYKLPLNLKILKINKTGIGDLVTTDLQKLEYVDASDNLEMIEFPLFDKNSKVRTVILLGVKLDHLVVTQIAPNCYIEKLYLSIEYLGGSQLLEPNKYCECTNIFRWVKQFKIESNLLHNELDVQCRSPDKSKSVAEICPEDNSYKAALALRDKCFKPPGGSFPKWIYFIGGAFILLLIGLILTLIFLDIKLATHIRRAHAALTGRSTDDSDEETQSENQPVQEDEPKPITDEE